MALSLLRSESPAVSPSPLLSLSAPPIDHDLLPTVPVASAAMSGGM